MFYLTFTTKSIVTHQYWAIQCD